MFIVLPGIVGHSSGGGGYPPYGTWLSSVCSGPNAHDQGATDYFDVNGTMFTGMFTLWEQFADGNGGSYWTNYGNNAQDTNNPPYLACWLPQYFYFDNSSNEVGFYWEACGSSGTFNYGQSSSYGYYNGDGSSTTGGGFSSYGYSSGWVIYDSSCCQVYYDGYSGYYYSDNCGGGGGGGGCPELGTYAYSGCVSTSGNDAKGQYWSGAWAYADFYNDGYCGYYQTNEQGNANGCYYPNGYWTTYYIDAANSFDWYVYDSVSNYVASGSFTYEIYAHGDRQNGNGSGGTEMDYWSANEGQQIASGSFTDSGDLYSYNYIVTYNGSQGYNVNIYPI